jgi:hypothetical protein
MSPLEVVRGARQLLLQDGWAKYTPRFDEARCVVMALIDAAKNDDEALKGAVEAVVQVTGADLLINWNDAPERTMWHVEAALDEAAKLLEVRS